MPREPRPAPDEAFLTTQQAARLLGVSVRTVQLWVESGVLHAWKTAGGHRRIARASVEAVREEQLEVIETVAGLQAKKILIVESNPTYLELYRIKVAGWHPAAVVATVDSGFEALVTTGKFAPDVILTELEMPGMDGFEMVRSLRNAAPGADIVVFSNLSEERIAAAGGLPEGTAMLRNPVDLDRLQALLAEIGKRAGAASRA